MADSQQSIARALELLKSGQVQEAADQLEEHRQQLQDEADAAAGKAKQPKPPRFPSEVILELLRSLVSHLGNRPEHLSLIDELEGLTGPRHK